MGRRREQLLNRGVLQKPAILGNTGERNPQFGQAVADFLEREGAGMANYIDELNERRPFKAAD